MLQYAARRLVSMVAMLFFVSIAAFVVIQLPPGDFLTTLVAGLEQGSLIDPAQLEYLKERFGLDQPIWIQYLRWVSGILLHGDFGYSFQWKRPVADLIWEQLGFTLMLSVSTLLFAWVVSFPIGVLSAVRQYSLADYFFTFIGFIGLAIPSFLLALVLMYTGVVVFHASVGGLFSRDFVNSPWSFEKVWDMIQHLPIPAIVLGFSGMAQLIRIMRANLLDELRKPYVITARAKGLSERRVILKYPVRVALNPFASTIGFLFPQVVSGSIIVSTVLSLPTVGPVLLQALIGQDMFLAGTIVLMIGTLTVIGILVSDLVLVWLDPRIRLYGGER